ncbi:MAG TPA: hypothetical protein VNN08_16260, partial [Thermoanaerobaculia bacterium]|nr:hypothetical protein [Thermoanaerobaculia bacterium]
TVAIGSEGVFYAPFVEFGHMTPKGGHVPAHPFLRPAFDEQAEEAARDVGDDLRDRIAQVVQ